VSGTDVILRALSPDDAQAWLDLRQEALLDTPEAFGSAPGEETLEIAQRRLSAARDSSEGFVIGAIEPEAALGIGAAPESRLVGNAGAFRERGAKYRHRARIWGVYVTPRVRGAGVAGQLVDEVIAQIPLRLPGVDWVDLQVWSENPAAIRLYQSRGFERVASLVDHIRVAGRAVDELLMTRRIP
jgi:ribosomal protein S18 acetylase RimI-like enzyme